MTSTSEFRPLLPDDWEQHQRLMNHAFSGGQVVTPRETPATEADVADVYGIFEDGHLIAALTAIPYTVAWPGAKNNQLPMGGIAGVATYVEARGQGHVERLLSESLRIMREKGQVVSALYPFAFAFYKKYGWDWVGKRYDLKVPLAHLQKTHSKTRRVLESNIISEVKPLFEAYGSHYRGFILDDEDWKKRFEPSGDKESFAYIGADGYLIARYGDENLNIKEFIAPSTKAHNALLGLLRNFGTQREFARLTVPSDSPIWSYIMHHDLETKTRPVFMGRVVDVAGALGQLQTSAPNGEVILALNDPQCDWNTGTWSIKTEGGRILATHSTQFPQVTMDIQAFSQAFWGYPSLASLRLAGRVEVKEEQVFDHLCAILQPCPVYNLIGF